MAHSLPTAVFHAWLRSRGVVHAVPVGGGLSGAEVFRVGSDAHGSGRREPQWAVRAWPPAVSGERVGEIHRAMRVARQAGCQWTPRVEPPESTFCSTTVASSEPHSWIVAGGRVWECCEWMVGSPPNVLRSQTTGDLLAVLRQVAVAVAQFHAAVRPLGHQLPSGPLQHPVPAVAARLKRLAELAPLLEPVLDSRDAFTGGFAPGSAVERARECLRQGWAAERQRAVRLLALWERVELRQQCVFRDIHLGNVLFHEGRLSGIVDYDAVRVDSPATDLARLIGSVRLVLAADDWARSEEQLWSEMLRAYREVGELSAAEERLARVLAEVSPLISLANWVVWVAVEGRSFPGPAAEIDARLVGWTRIMQQQMAAGLSNSTGIETR